MSQKLNQVWPNIDPTDEIELEHIEKSKDGNGIVLPLFCPRFERGVAAKIAENLKKTYPNTNIEIRCTYPAAQFCEQACFELVDILASRGVAVNGYFEDAKVSAENGQVRFELSHGGASLLHSMKFCEKFSEAARECFGISCDVTLGGVTECVVAEKPVRITAAPMTGSAEGKDTVHPQPKAPAPARTPAPAPKPQAQTQQYPRRRRSQEPAQGGRIDLEALSYLDIELAREECDPVLGRMPNAEELKPIKEIAFETGKATVFGRVFATEKKELRSGASLCYIQITDGTGSIEMKLFQNSPATDAAFALSNGEYIIVSGSMGFDQYEKELIMSVRDIVKVYPKGREDNAPEKRVELHLHTNMSMMDALPSAKAVIKRAIQFGHSAVAITDHGVVQSYPEARDTLLDVRKNGHEDFNLIYGIECYYVDDTTRSVRGDSCEPLNGEFVIFDIETTGLSARDDRITEIGAVRLRDGVRVDSFSTFVDPEMHIPESNTAITHITDDMVKGAPKEREALRSFLDYVGDSVLIAHNGTFDCMFIKTASIRQGFKFKNTNIDTLPIARAMLPELSRHKLDTLAKHLHIPQSNHHRALDDAETLAEIWLRLVELLSAHGAERVSDINSCARVGTDKQKPYHMTLLVKNMTGLRNLYELVSKSHLEYFANKRPRIPRSELEKFREGLLIGSACEAGEVFGAVLDGVPHDELLEIADKYDYFEIMPVCNNEFLVREGRVKDDDGLRDLNREIIALARELNRPVVATGDVHFLDKTDAVYRSILTAGMGFDDADKEPLLYFRTTEEMLEEFSYLGEELAHEVVIDAPNKIAEQIDHDITPIPTQTYTPSIEGAEDMLRQLSHEGLAKLYGEHPDEAVVARMDKELSSIIGNGYSVLYVIAQKLVFYSEEHGYHVGSRGSVGSSFIATLVGITEVNPLPPHYVCPKCHHFEWHTEAKSGFDLPDAYCPECGAKMHGDGQDIPFETFLGFHGDKQPDIDLNFSGEFQQEAHRYTEELFGKEHVFKAGTISALQDKNAYGYVKKYLEERGITANRAELNRLTLGITGVKKTTGQHPGGMVVIPSQYSINDFTPAQHPADKDSDIITTHFDFSSLHDTLLKLDELGHEVPTKMHYLERLTGVPCADIPMNDPDVMKLFTSTEPLGVTEQDIDSKTGTLGLPEMGTEIVRSVLIGSQPHMFSDLVQVSGLTHGTGVWAGNAEELIKAGTCLLGEVIGTRDSIMLSLIKYGLEPAMAFKIMEITRKGKAPKLLTQEHFDAMKACGVPQWFVDSCLKIQYMFPKAHAVAYVMSAIRLGWYKLHYPLEYYSVYFTVSGDEIDAATALKGLPAVRAKLEEQKALDRDARKAKDKVEQTIMQIVCEMLSRGYEFLPVSLTKSHYNEYLIEDGKLRMPFSAVKGIGGAAAMALYEAAKRGPYLSVEELLHQPGVTPSLVDSLTQVGGLDGMPTTSQMSFF